MRTTQKDIAEKLGISISLVSRVLSGQEDKIGAKKETAKQIKDLAKKMNYIPSTAALSLKGKSIKTIGVVVYDFEDEYFSLLIKNLQILAQEYNYSLLLVGFLNRIPQSTDLFTLHKHSLDGVIILGSFGVTDWIDSMPYIPIVRIGHGTHANIKTNVTVDENDAMSQILTYLNSDLKFSEIVFASRDLQVQELRKEIFEEISQAMGINSLCVNAIESETDFNSGKEIATNILNRGGNLPQAIICANDLMAMGAISTFTKAGLIIPRDLTILGFDDIPSAKNYIPPLSSFRQPVEKFAREAFEALVVEDKTEFTNSFKGNLILRESSKNPNSITKD